MNLALSGYGTWGAAFARLLHRKARLLPLPHLRHSTRAHGHGRWSPQGPAARAAVGPPAASIGEFLDAGPGRGPIEVTPLDPTTGEPAISHIRAASRAAMHVITATRGPIAHAYHALDESAAAAGVGFRYRVHRHGWRARLQPGAERACPAANPGLTAFELHHQDRGKDHARRSLDEDGIRVAQRWALPRPTAIL